MKKLLCIILLAIAGSLQAAQVNVEAKEQAEKQLSAEEQAAVKKMFDIVQYETISDAQLNELRALLQRYPRIVDAQNNDGWNNDGWISDLGTTPLMYAARNGYAEIVKLLIAADAQIDAQDNDGRTPLMWTAHRGHAEIVKLLIAAGAQIDAQNNNGATPLMYATSYDHAEIVRLLIAAGAQIDVKSNDGLTPLMLAARNGYAEIVQLLIAASADETLQNNDRKTALDIAMEGHQDHDSDDDSAFARENKKIYDKAVTAGLAERKRYEQAQQVAKKELELYMIPDLAKITAEYAYNPQVPEDLPKSPETKQSWWDKAKSLASKWYQGNR